VIFSAGAEDGEDGRRLRTDQVGFSRIEAAVDGLVVIDRVAPLLEFIAMLRRRARRQWAQIDIITGFLQFMFFLFRIFSRSDLCVWWLIVNLFNSQFEISSIMESSISNAI